MSPCVARKKKEGNNTFETQVTYFCISLTFYCLQIWQYELTNQVSYKLGLILLVDRIMFE